MPPYRVRALIFSGSIALSAAIERTANSLTVRAVEIE